MKEQPTQEQINALFGLCPICKERAYLKIQDNYCDECAEKLHQDDPDDGKSAL